MPTITAEPKLEADRHEDRPAVLVDCGDARVVEYDCPQVPRKLPDGLFLLQK